MNTVERLHYALQTLICFTAALVGCLTRRRVNQPPTHPPRPPRVKIRPPHPIPGSWIWTVHTKEGMVQNHQYISMNVQWNVHGCRHVPIDSDPDGINVPLTSQGTHSASDPGDNTVSPTSPATHFENTRALQFQGFPTCSHTIPMSDVRCKCAANAVTNPSSAKHGHHGFEQG